MERCWTTSAEALVDTQLTVILLERAIVVPHIHGLVQLTESLIVALGHWVVLRCPYVWTSSGYCAPAFLNRAQTIL